jgi:hypothetical protein
MKGRRAGSAPQATYLGGRRLKYVTGSSEWRSLEYPAGLCGSRPPRHATGAVRPIDGFRGRGVALESSFWRAPLAGSGRSLPGEVTSWTT